MASKGQQSLVIQAPRQGIAPSPHLGFADMQNIDIDSIPGIIKLNTILEKKSGTTVDAQVKWMVKNPASPSNLYALDSNGSVYNSSDSGATWAELSDREGEGEGLAVWKDYLIVNDGDKLDTYGPLSGAPAWTDDWQSTPQDDGVWGPMLVSKLDGNLYIGNGRYISSISENSGQDFVPGTTASFTYTSQALTLPEDYRIKCLAELNNNLMVGTWQGTNIYDNKIADIFPWDGSSETYNNPIQLNENGINAMINIAGNLYILAGLGGKIYKSNGVQAWAIGEIPLSVANIDGGKYLEPFPGAIMSFKDKLYFGINSNSTSNMGIYSLMETSSGNIVNMEHSISTLTTGGTNPLIIGALLGITRDQFVCGWRDNATYGIDKLSTTSFAYSTNYSGFFESALYQVGSYLNLMQFTSMEFILAKELATSEGIQIKYRINLTDDWTTLGTYTTANIGSGKTSFRENQIAIPPCEQLQIRVEFLGTSTTTPEFKQLILV
jgi:hypothetical protein